MYCPKNKCNAVIIARRRHRYPSSGANKPSDVVVTVNVNAEFNLMPVNPIIEWFWRDPIPEHCQVLDASVISTGPPSLVEGLDGRTNRSVPRLPLQMHANESIATCLTSNIYLGLLLTQPLTLTQIRSYEILKVFPIVRINTSESVRDILNFHLRRDMFPYRLARGRPLMWGVLYSLQSKVRTPLPHCHRTIPMWQISLNAGLSPRPQHCDGQ